MGSTYSLHKFKSRKTYLLPKRSGVLQSDLVHIYLTLVHPVVEYACQVCYPGLTKEQSQTLESIQKRALRIISPGETWGCMFCIKVTHPETEMYFLCKWCTKSLLLRQIFISPCFNADGCNTTPKFRKCTTIFIWHYIFYVKCKKIDNIHRMNVKSWWKNENTKSHIY